MSLRQRLRRAYALGLGVLAALGVAGRLAAPGSDLPVVALFLAALGAIPFAARGVRWAWRRLTYRVGVRLFLSYVLIGLTPFAVCAFAALLAGYVLAGQFAATRVRGEMNRLAGAMAERAAGAVRSLAAARPDQAKDVLERERPAGAGDLREEWVLAAGTQEWRSQGAATLPVPRWVGEGGWSGEVVADGSSFLAAVARRGDTVAAVLLPLDLGNARAFPRESWYELRFVTSVKQATAVGAAGGTVTVGTREGKGEGATFRVNGRPVLDTQVERGWLAAEPPRGTFWQRARVLWVWMAGTPRQLADGSPAPHAVALALLKLSPSGALEDLFGASDPLRGDAKRMVFTVAGFFAAIYLIAVGFAALMIVRVTSAAARLTRGAAAVAAGNLDYRIPVKRRDQLGDLSIAFNTMAESVRSMLAQVAEKERMAREVELAREIQSSLLPPAELSVGPLSVWAHFRPAAEVGGDYFDFFPLAPGNLLVAIGDVAGHGLPTGLLMAMVKSAVATLVEEGYRGTELLSRLNRLLLAQPLRQRMVSLALAEADAVRGEVTITSAGHQPGVLLAAEGPAQEVLLSSLPLGHRWPDGPTAQTLPFAPGARLLLYSDGLVEARDASGVPFGHERLREAMEACRGDDGPGLVRALLAELDGHLAGAPLADDLTVVLLENGPAGVA